MANTKTRRDYRTQGQGVHFPYGTPSHKEMERINEVVYLDRQLERYRNMRSRMGLFKVAARYRRLGGFAVEIAKRVKSEARNLD